MGISTMNGHFLSLWLFARGCHLLHAICPQELPAKAVSSASWNCDNTWTTSMNWMRSSEKPLNLRTGLYPIYIHILYICNLISLSIYYRHYTYIETWKWCNIWYLISDTYMFTYMNIYIYVCIWVRCVFRAPWDIVITVGYHHCFF